jgi:hypothetical protein
MRAGTACSAPVAHPDPPLPFLSPAWPRVLTPEDPTTGRHWPAHRGRGSHALGHDKVGGQGRVLSETRSKRRFRYRPRAGRHAGRGLVIAPSLRCWPVPRFRFASRRARIASGRPFSRGRRRPARAAVRRHIPGSRPCRVRVPLVGSFDCWPGFTGSGPNPRAARGASRDELADDGSKRPASGPRSRCGVAWPFRSHAAEILRTSCWLTLR